MQVFEVKIIKLFQDAPPYFSLLLKRSPHTPKNAGAGVSVEGYTHSDL